MPDIIGLNPDLEFRKLFMQQERHERYDEMKKYGKRDLICFSFIVCIVLSFIYLVDLRIESVLLLGGLYVAYAVWAWWDMNHNMDYEFDLAKYSKTYQFYKLLEDSCICGIDVCRGNVKLALADIDWCDPEEYVIKGFKEVYKDDILNVIIDLNTDTIYYPTMIA